MNPEEEDKQWRAQVIQTRREKVGEGERLWNDDLGHERDGYVNNLVSTDDPEERRKIYQKIQELDAIQQAQKDEDAAAAAAATPIVKEGGAFELMLWITFMYLRTTAHTI